VVGHEPNINIQYYSMKYCLFGIDVTIKGMIKEQPCFRETIMKYLLTDEAIWNVACQASFVSPPRQWSFGNNIISFGKELYHIDEATVYELALLDIHAQYWEATSPEYLRRYHRVLQYNVEHCFQSNNTLVQLHYTPSFLFSWLSRTIFRKLHDQKGREKMSYILKDVSEVLRSKLENGNFQANGMSFIVS
jgi:hypothetical protein